IVSIEVNADGTRSYITRGDKYLDNDPGTKTNNDIVGKLVGVKAGGGKIVSFMGSSAGFFVCVVLPTLIIVAIAASNLVFVILREKKSQKAVAEQAQQEVLADERERIRQELLAEMQMQYQVQTASETAEAVVKAEKSADEPVGGQTANTDSSDDKKE
ncbi:MAG: hypothetical protein K2O81_06880, partial [Clostridia bacterium]|nr:hypothetical protein [Clostridia bacterium]